MQLGNLLKILVLGGLLLPLQLNAVIVLVETPLGDFQIDLFEDETPNTVRNFITYIDDGSFENSFFHRSSTDFVLQGGSYTLRDETLEEIPAKDPVDNEFNRSNLRGTIAMAKVSGDPNSATSSWFINLSDNSGNLDNQNGGFTVFGEVLGDGMNIVDAIHALEVFDASETSGADFSELPLIDYPGTGVITADHLVFTQMSLPDELNEITDLVVTKTVDNANPAANNSVEFTITVTNSGDDDATDLEILDALPAGMEIPVGMAPFASVGSYDAETGIWEFDSLTTGNNATLNIPAIPQQFTNPECFVNQAEVGDFGGLDSNQENSSDIATVFVGGLTTCAELTLSVTPSVLFSGVCTTQFPDSLDFTVRVNNAGPDTAQNVEVTLSGSLGETVQNDIVISLDEIPAGVTDSVIRRWFLDCDRAALVASYSAVVTTDTVVSTDSVLTVNEDFDVEINEPVDTPTNTPTSSGGGGGCFIATAAYGSYMHPQVYKLREFRDNVLMKSELGRNFITLYYKYSPPMAMVIENNQYLRLITRIILTPLVYAVVYPVVTILFAGFLLLSLVYSRRDRILNKG